MSRVRLTSAARADLDDALSWYEAKAPQIVPHFRRALIDVIARIDANPRQFPTSTQETRRALMRRFPYSIIFRETQDECIVVAIFHLRRDPRPNDSRV